MQSVLEILVEKVKTNNKGLTVEEIAQELPTGYFYTKDKSEIKSKILTEILIDGRFLLVNGKWDLKENYTLNEIRKYKSLEMIDDNEEVEEVEEELEGLVELPSEDDDGEDDLEDLIITNMDDEDEN